MALPARQHEDADWTTLCDYARRAARGTRWADWEDIAQEALLRLWTRGPAGADTNRCRAWLATVVRNLAADRARATKAKCRGGDSRIMSLDARVAGETDPDSDAKRQGDGHEYHGGGMDLAEVVALRLTVWPLYRRLPDGYRRALALRVQGWGQREIARALGIPSGTVKSRLSYAAARMRRMLADVEAG